MIVRQFMKSSVGTDEGVTFLARNFSSVVGLVAKKCLANTVRFLGGSSQARGNVVDLASIEDSMSGWN